MELEKQPVSNTGSLAEPAERVSAKKPRERIDIKQPARLWVIVLLLGWTFDFLFWKGSMGVNFAIFSFLCLIGGLYLLIVEGYQPAKNSLWLLIPFAFFAVMTFLRQEPLTVFLAYTFVVFSIGLFATSYLGGRWFQYGLLDYFHKFFRFVESLIGQPIELLAQTQKERTEKGEAGKTWPVWGLLRGLVIAVPIVACFATLLASADVVFSQKLGDFFGLFSVGKIAEYFLRFALILFYGYLLAGVFLHTATRSKDEKLVGENKPIIKPFLGFTESAVVLGSVSLLFAAFVIIQFQYFFGGETNIGVAGYTYSQYARRGFNELVIVAFFSLVMILGLSTITRRQKDVEKRVYSGLSVGVVGLVMVILVSAYQRISLAIDWHGFSRLRLYPRVFLVWLGVLLVTVVVLEILRQERYFALAAALASVGFAVSLTLVNVDAAIVRHNVPRVLQGKNLNVAHLASLSLDAVPPLVDEFFSKSLPASAHEGVGAALSCYKNFQYDSGDQSKDWRTFNLSQWRAQKALERVRPYLVGYFIKTKTGKVHTPSNLIYECHYYESSAED